MIRLRLGQTLVYKHTTDRMRQWHIEAHSGTLPRDKLAVAGSSQYSKAPKWHACHMRNVMRASGPVWITIQIQCYTRESAAARFQEVPLEEHPLVCELPLSA